MMRSLAKIGLLVGLLSSCATHQARPTSNSTQAPPALSESELDAALRKTAAESLGDREGAVIVIDPQNGRIRAVVNSRVAFEQAFPPGSAIKPFTALAALRSGLLNREFRHQCRTRYARDDFEIVCSHPVSNSPFDLPQALAYSCNNFFARVGERLGEGAFNSTLGAFGFGEKTGLNANESSGELPRGDWGVRDALGESDHLLVTPVQLITAYAALINGGHLYRPQQSTDHNLIAQERLRLNIAPEHRSTLIEGMRGSAKYGTASKAGLGALTGYVFGKTGTSTSSVRWRTQGWFVGFVAEKSPVGPPRAEQIKLGVLVFIKRAHGSQAADLARPIFDCGLRTADCGSLKAEVRAGEGESGRAGERESGRQRDGETGRQGDRETRGQGDKENPQPAIGNPQPAIGNPQSAIGNRQSAIRNQVIGIPQTVKVRTVSENLTREAALEDYVTGVLGAESSVEDEVEALKAQAVVSRTFTLKNLGRHGREGYDFCSTTHCQRYVFTKTKNSVNAAARRAVEETAGVILIDPISGATRPPPAGQVIDAYFHASCGGMTANIETLWGATAPSYLRGVRDDFCATAPHRRWTQKIPADQLAKAFQSDERSNVGARVVSITVTRRDPTGRAETIAIDGERRRRVRGWDFKIIVGRSLGWQMIKSSRFVVSRSGDDFVFSGGGFGHGLGLCQEGAHVASRRGMTYRQILNHYFPGTRLTRAGSDRFENSRVFAPESLRRLTGGGTTGTTPVETPSPERAIDRSRFGAPPGLEVLGSRSRWLHTSVYTQIVEPWFSRGYAARFAEVAMPFRISRSFSSGLCPTSRAGRQVIQRRSQAAYLSSEHFRATYPANADARSIENALRMLENARADLLGRLEAASLRLAEPGPYEVVVHATTADFIAATGQSGWASGATRGRRIELQPLGLLKRRGVLNATLRHEMTHAVIEALSDGRAPRWMAEGLAVYVAGEVSALPLIEKKDRLTRDELERKLTRPASVAESQVAESRVAESRVAESRVAESRVAESRVAESRKLYALAYHEIRAMIEAEGEAGLWRRVANSAARK